MRNTFLLLICFFLLTNCAFTKSDEVLFKFVRGSFENLKTREEILLIYKSGKIECESFRQEQGKEFHSPKTACLNISQETVKELTKHSEESDFRNAAKSYKVFERGVDYGSWAIIQSFRKEGEKTVKLDNYDKNHNEKADSLPKSVAKFLQKLAEIDEDLEIKYEL